MFDCSFLFFFSIKKISLICWIFSFYMKTHLFNTLRTQLNANGGYLYIMKRYSLMAIACLCSCDNYWKIYSFSYKMKEVYLIFYKILSGFWYWYDWVFDKMLIYKNEWVRASEWTNEWMNERVSERMSKRTSEWASAFTHIAK